MSGYINYEDWLAELQDSDVDLSNPIVLLKTLYEAERTIYSLRQTNKE